MSQSGPSTTTRASLLSRVRDPENQAAWREFDERYRGLILRYCRRRGLQLSDSEDVTQIVLVSLAKSLRNFRYRPDLGRFRDYLGRSVRNAITRQKSKRKTDGVGSETDVFEGVPNGKAEIDETWDQEWMQHHFRVAMELIRKHFEPQSMGCFELLLQGRPVHEVAAEFGTTPDAVYKLKQRIRDRLKEQVARQIVDEEFPERLSR